MKRSIGYEIICDGCREEKYDADPDKERPFGWQRIKRKDYCQKCARIRDKKNVKKFPSQYRVHTPSGAIFACGEHMTQLQNLYNVLGSHITVELIKSGQVACINCLNESENESEKYD